MPPVARSVVHGEAAALINEWVKTSLPAIDNADENEVQNEDDCNDSERPLLATELPSAELSKVLSEIQLNSGGAISMLMVTDFLASITNASSSAPSSPTQRSERSLYLSPQPPFR
jgi:hypothetical protein